MKYWAPVMKHLVLYKAIKKIEMCFHNRSSRCVGASHINNIRQEVKRDLENYHVTINSILKCINAGLHKNAQIR